MYFPEGLNRCGVSGNIPVVQWRHHRGAGVTFVWSRLLLVMAAREEEQQHFD